MDSRIEQKSFANQSYLKGIVNVKEEILKKEKELSDFDQKIQSLQGQNDRLTKEILELTRVDFVAKEIEKAEKMKNFKAINWEPDFSINPIKDASQFPKKEKTQQELNTEKLRQELNAINKQVIDTQKQINTIKNKSETLQVFERCQALDNLISEKKNAIDLINNEIKTQESIRKGHESMIEDLKNQRGYSDKIKILQEDKKKYKGEIIKLQQEMKTQDTQFKEQTKYLQLLLNLYREFCAKHNISASTNTTREEQMNSYKDEVAKNIELFKEKGRSLKTEKVESKKIIKYQNPKVLKKDISIPENWKSDEQFINSNIPQPINEAYYKDIKQRIRNAKQDMNQNQAKQDQQVIQLTNKIAELTFEQKDLQKRLKEKEKEAIVAVTKFHEVQRITKNTQIVDLEIDNKLKLQLDLSKKSLIKKLLSSNKQRKTKRQIVGNIDSDSLVIFDDADLMANKVNQKIYKIKIFHDQNEVIYGFQATYIQNNEEVEGPMNLHYSFQKQLESDGFLKTQEFVIELLNGDELKFISGQYSNQIECLKLETIKGNSITVGKIKKNSKEFHIDIKRDEHPIILFGALDIKKNAQNYQELVLSCIGVEINNPFYHYNLKEKKGNEIEELIIPEDEQATIRRGLFPSKLRANQFKI